MQYDVIVIGATFTAAGLLQGYGDGCLILERRPQAGYEFLSALKFGSGFDQPLQSAEAKALRAGFEERGAFEDGRVNLFDCASLLYARLKGKNVMLNMTPVQIEKDGDGFAVTAHGASGFRSYRAKHLIDTTVRPDIIAEKSLNALINSDTETAPFPGAAEEKIGCPGDLLLKCGVPADADYAQARRALAEKINALPPAYKLAVIADCFDESVKGTYPAEKDGITHLPSCGFANPLLAFDAGVVFAKGGERA